MSDKKIDFDQEKLQLERDRFNFEQSKHLHDLWDKKELATEQLVRWTFTVQAFIGAIYVYFSGESVACHMAIRLGPIFQFIPFFAAAICIVAGLAMWGAQTEQDEIREMAPPSLFGLKKFPMNLRRTAPIFVTFAFSLAWLIFGFVML